MLGYTGTFKGKPISVQSVGMGCASAAIYYSELIQLGAQRIIRVGTAGGLADGLQMADTVVAISATADDPIVGHPHRRRGARADRDMVARRAQPSPWLARGRHGARRPHRVERAVLRPAARGSCSAGRSAATWRRDGGRVLYTLGAIHKIETLAW